MKTVFISGGSKGIGACVARELRKVGYNVAIGFCSSQVEANKLAKEIGCLAVKCDVKNVAEIETAIETIHSVFGKIDTLVNCAGIAPKQEVFTNTTQEEYDNTFAINMRGTFMVTKKVVEDMISLGYGSIVNVSSIWGLDGGSCEVLYSATKGAVTAFTKALAKELGPSKIRVNEVAPGFIDTDMNAHITEADRKAFCDNVALNRIANPEEVAKAIAFLLSSDASYITGQTLRVDGGLL